ncbi:MAG: hypothetical protein ACUVT4_08195, partial [Actinomycetota bacterium]
NRRDGGRGGGGDGEDRRAEEEAGSLRIGDPDGGIMVCGQDIGLVREIRPIAEIIAGMVEEAEAVMERIAAPGDGGGFGCVG